jgi:hypothetical protein
MPTTLVPSTTRTGKTPRPCETLFRRSSPSKEWVLDCSDELAPFLSPETETFLWAYPIEVEDS